MFALTETRNHDDRYDQQQNDKRENHVNWFVIRHFVVVFASESDG